METVIRIALGAWFVLAGLMTIALLLWGMIGTLVEGWRDDHE